ncbi:MAG: glycoside hydrolase family 3 C-terminal domain-containing protein [Calditrichaceae bacterium]|nr:glycoside hydrolase family 3 C-terminal domain-containing protein [Calditrichaceae bacterium]
MRVILIGFVILTLFFACTKIKHNKKSPVAVLPPLSFEEADLRADSVLAKLSLNEKIEMIGGHNMFYIKGYPEHGIPQLYLSDATQGVNIRRHLPDQLEKSTAFPCPIGLTATWNINLAHQYAKAIGEECRAGGIAVLLGPGMNMYRISQGGRNFEYFGEDPFLASQMIGNYVEGLQSTGTIATLKHFFCNNTDHNRRTSNSIVDERTLHEIYLPAFKAGIDAGARAVMTSYNQVNGEWAGQSDYVINKLLRQDLGFKWLVMTDWWSVWDPVKVIKSGMDLDMPGEAFEWMPSLKSLGDIYVRNSAMRLLQENKIAEEDINRMVKSIIRTSVSMGLYDRPIKDEYFLSKYEEHEQVALKSAREAIVLLRNDNNILPLDKGAGKQILVTGEFLEEIYAGGGAARVEGYNHITMKKALQDEFGESVKFDESPSNEKIQKADIVLLSVGTRDSEGYDRSFNLPEEMENKIIKVASLNPNAIVIVNSGGGIKMTDWNEKVAAILYAWYPGQTGHRALAEIISGKVNPSGKLPITIEKRFEDSPGYPYIPEGDYLRSNWDDDLNMDLPVYDIHYDEGVFIGYRWYEAQKIDPLYPFGFGLSYTSFEYSDFKVSNATINKGDSISVSFAIRNSGAIAGAEIAQLYIRDVKSSVSRPLKELKGFGKVFLEPGESKIISIALTEKEFSFYDEKIHSWRVEPGEFQILIGSSSTDIRQQVKVTFL